MVKIIISYRRRDSDAITGRIFDRLVSRYGRDAVFRDIDNIPLGIDFRTHISDVLRQSDIVLAIVGPRWTARSRGGRARIEDEADPVRAEVETALQRGIPVIPVLLGNTRMPSANQLPEALKDFAFRNAVRVDPGQDFEHHVDRLVREMDRFLLGCKPEPDKSIGAAEPETAGTEIVETAIELPALCLPDKPSIAVLPFQNMSNDPDQEYFADGMVEEITTAIARLPWLFVIARNSSFSYKNKSLDLRQVGRELGVRYVLEGSVRKSGSLVRIIGQLIDTTTGAHIWADRIDGSLDDVFDLQEQVASKVLGAIEPKLRQSEMRRAARKPTANLDTYDLYLRALAQIHKMSPESWREAIHLVQRALHNDPSYAPAGALFGWCRAWQRSHGWENPSEQQIAEAVTLAKQAVDDGKDDPDVLSMAGWAISYFTGDHTTGLSLFERALTLNANSTVTWNARGWVLMFANHPDLSIASFERAMRLSPLDPLAYLCKAGLALAHMEAGRYGDAMNWIDQSLREQPRYAAAVRYKASLCGHVGSVEERQKWVRRVLELYPGLTIASLKPYLTSMNIPEVAAILLEGLRKAGLPEE